MTLNQFSMAQKATEPTSSSAAADQPLQPDLPAAEQQQEEPSTADTDSSEPGCPICQFIEAGPCGGEHKVWVACRNEAKEQDVDFVQHCGNQFRAFFGCMLSHQEYYQPFLEAFHVDVDRSQEAIDKVRDREQQQQQQQEQKQGEQRHHQPTASQTQPLGAGNARQADVEHQQGSAAVPAAVPAAAAIAAVGQQESKVAAGKRQAGGDAATAGSSSSSSSSSSISTAAA